MLELWTDWDWVTGQTVCRANYRVAAATRVAIARALVHNPAVVLADEPTASLDTERAHQVVETFANLIHEQQRSGIMVTHDLRMVRYADRVVQMEDGHIVREIQA